MFPFATHQILDRAVLRQTVHDLALYSGASTWRARSQRARRILTLHGVGGDDMPLHRFKQLMRWLRTHARIVPLPELLADLQSQRAPSQDLEIALTFDDGLANQFHAAYPVLREMNLSATIFVCPQLIDERRWLWNHEARARWKRLGAEVQTALARDLGTDGRDANLVVARMKELPDAARAELCVRLRAATSDFRPEPAESAAHDLMDWEQIKRMDPALITIGSHSLSHPILTTLPDGDLERELRDSRAELESRLDRSTPIFCYPNGSMDARVRYHTSRYYDAAVSTAEALIETKPIDLWALPRIPVSSHLGLSVWRLHSPQS